MLRPQALDMGATLEIALKMFPETLVVLVSGAAVGDRRLENEARRIFSPWRDKLEFQYTSDRSLEEILQLVASLPPRSIVIYNNVFSDKTGRTFTPLGGRKTVAKVANAPVFCFWDTLMEGGPIGGSLLSFEAEGAFAANVALDILNGKIIPTEPVTTLPTSKTVMFDWRQLRRWSLSEAALPKGSIILNREPTLWDYQYYILGILGIGVTQLLLIVGLLAQRSRMAKADEALRERLKFEGLLSILSAKLLKAASHEVDREIGGALKGIVDFLGVSHAVLIGGFPEENKALVTHAANADDVPPTPLWENRVSALWTSKTMAQGEPLWVPTLDKLPAEAAVDKEMYRSLGVRSFMIVPILIEGLPKYAIATSSHQEERAWPAEYIPRLALLGDILVNTLERKQGEESLRQKTEELDRFFNVSLDLLCVANTDGYFLRLNPAAERILGYTREELTAKPFFDFIHPDDLDRSGEAVSILASQQSLFSFENRYRCKDGTYRWLQWSSAPAGKLFYAAARDVTEQKVSAEALRKAHEELQQEMAKREKAEQQLLQAQKLESIGTLTGGIAHDFNNILGAIVINSELALLDLPAGSDVRTNLDLILKSGLRGKDLVRQMLLFSRKSEKKQEIVTLTPLTKETFKLLRSSIPTTIQMELLLEAKSDAVSADPSQIQQVIMNLCTNAAYAMRGTKGCIDISLQSITFNSTDLPEADMQPGDYLALSVKDTGSGMDEEVRRRIFEPFFTTKPFGEGTGLGLSVVYGIVKNHKGGITVHSEPGKGSIFRVYLPKVDIGPSVAIETPKPILRGNERILFVDDEEIMVNSVRNMLQHLGYKVTAVMDSQEALNLFSADPSQFDLVMTDQTMPLMTGEELGKAIMGLRSGTPVILCTGYSDLISSERAMVAGFRGYIMKPFTLREGAELVRRVLDQKRST